MKEQLIESYERQLENLKWNLENNSGLMNEIQVSILQQRIRDFTQFIYDLNRI